MSLDSRGYVSIAELIVYIPAAITSCIICSRHGFSRSSGWIYTLILCIVRIVGAICQLVTYNSPSVDLIKTTLIVDSIGLSPLLLATLGMLSRLTDQINYHSGTQGFLKLSHFRLLQLLITIGLILGIAGGTSTSPSSGGSASTTSEAGIIIYIISFVALLLILFVAFGNLSALPLRERRIAAGVSFAAPFILVRLAYSTLAVFLHNSDFSIISGSVPIRVGMAVVEEFVVVFIYILLGFLVNVLGRDEQGPIQSRQWKQRGTRDSHRRRPRQSAQHYPSRRQDNAEDLESYPPRAYARGDRS